MGTICERVRSRGALALFQRPCGRGSRRLGHARARLCCHLLLESTARRGGGYAVDEGWWSGMFGVPPRQEGQELCPKVGRVWQDLLGSEGCNFDFWLVGKC